MDLTGVNGRLLLRLMSASSKRAEVTANNLANQNTPGFKRQTVDFEDQLLAEIRRGGSNLESVQPSVNEDKTSPARADGNNVSMELEMSTMNQNRLMYETYAAVLAGRMEMIRTSIQESR